MKHRDWERPMVEKEARKDSDQPGWQRNQVIGMNHESAHFERGVGVSIVSKRSGEIVRRVR